MEVLMTIWGTPTWAGPAKNRLPRRLAQGVVAAGQHLRDIIDPQPVEVLQHIKRELLQKGEVVGCVYDQHAFGIRSEPIHVRPVLLEQLIIISKRFRSGRVAAIHEEVQDAPKPKGTTSTRQQNW